MVLLVLYVVSAAITALAIRGGRALQPPPGEEEAPNLAGVRIAVALVSLLFAVVGVVALLDVAEEPDHALYSKALAYAIFGSLPLGSALYVLGAIVWRGPVAFGLRVGGWCVMALGLLVPSVLTLGLPVLAVLAVTLRRIPRRPAATADAAAADSPPVSRR